MITAIIPARGGSVRIPRKNVRSFHGKPIIAYSIETAKASRLFDSIIVSTDDNEISEIAQQYGADVMIRGPEWCVDSVGPLDVARHCLDLMTNVDLVCVIYATAPLMGVADLMRGYREVIIPGVAYSVSVGWEPLHDAAQFFWCQPWALRERVPDFAEFSTMVPISAARDCDINVEADWIRAEAMYSELRS